MPDHPRQLLRRLVDLIGSLVEELHQLCLTENVDKGIYVVQHFKVYMLCNTSRYVCCATLK